jgi:hypothetical protein
VSLAVAQAAASPAPSAAARAAKCQDVFRPLPAARPGHDPVSAATGDFNEDRRPDLAVIRRVSDLNATALTVLPGKGDGRFRAPGPLMRVGEAGEALAGEFTGDAHRDLLVVPQVRPGITLLAGDGAGRFTSRDQGFAFGRYARARAVADLNGDGHATWSSTLRARAPRRALVSDPTCMCSSEMAPRASGKPPAALSP